MQSSTINGSLPIELHFSTPMNCSSVAASIALQSTTESGTEAALDPASVKCAPVPAEAASNFFGSLPTTWKFQATLVNVADGVHSLSVQNAASVNPNITTGAVDRFFVRVGEDENPVVFPQTANYSRTLLQKSTTGQLFISHQASGASQFRYSRNWGSSYSSWQPYRGGNTLLESQPWSGTSSQEWTGNHVIVQYHSSILGSSNHIQHGDLDSTLPARRFPHLFLEGEFNQFGTDVGIQNRMEMEHDGVWTYNFLAEWPSNLQINQWGINPSGKLDVSGIFGDVDGDNVLDRLPPSSLLQAMITFNHTPVSPYLSWKLAVNDGDFRYQLIPSGNRWHQLLVYILLWTVPLLTGSIGVWLYLQS
jgi:alpha-1,3-glucan synthase